MFLEFVIKHAMNDVPRGTNPEGRGATTVVWVIVFLQGGGGGT
jgi:hypothetical protein